MIGNMYVGDGICDCCDCSFGNLFIFNHSDEGESRVTHCAETNQNVLNSLERQLLQEQKGVEATKDIPGTKQLLKRLKKQLSSIQRELQSILSSYRSRGGVTKEEMKRYQDLQHFHAIVEGVDSLVKAKNKKALVNMLGDRLKFLSLLSHCLYSAPFGRR